MSYATVPAYHAFMAAKTTIEQATLAMRLRIEQHARLQVRRRWWSFRRASPSRMLQAANQLELERGQAIARVMNLSIAAMTGDPGAMVALDEAAFDLIHEAFFDPKVATEARVQLAFASMPGGTA